MFAESLLAHVTSRRKYPCANVDLGETRLCPAVCQRRGFRSNVEVERTNKSRERARLAKRFDRSFEMTQSQQYETFPALKNSDPPPLGGRRDDVLLPQHEGGRELVIKYVDGAMRKIFPPLPERTFENVAVAVPSTCDSTVVDVRDLRVTCPWEPYSDDSVDTQVVQRALPASPFRERTAVFDVYPPPALPQLLQRLKEGSFVKGSSFDPESCASDRPLAPVERDNLVLESTRRTMSSCPPTIEHIAASKFLSTSSQKTHEGTEKYRKWLKAKAVGDVQQASLSNTSSFFSAAAPMNHLQRNRSVKMFGTYLQQ